MGLGSCWMSATRNETREGMLYTKARSCSRNGLTIKAELQILVGIPKKSIHHSRAHMGRR